MAELRGAGQLRSRVVKILLFFPGDRWQSVSIGAMLLSKFTGGKRVVAAAGCKGQFLPQALVLPFVVQAAQMRDAIGGGDGDAAYMTVLLRFVLVQHFSSQIPEFSSVDLAYGKKRN